MFHCVLLNYWDTLQEHFVEVLTLLITFVHYLLSYFCNSRSLKCNIYLTKCSLYPRNLVPQVFFLYTYRLKSSLDH